MRVSKTWLGILALAAVLAFCPETPALSQPAQCGRTAPGSGAASATIITGQAGATIHLCGWDVTATAAATFQLVYGTGTNCATGLTAITAAHAMTGQNTINTSAATPGRFSVPPPNPPTNPPNNVCVIITGTGPVQWTVYYTQLF